MHERQGAGQRRAAGRPAKRGAGRPQLRPASDADRAWLAARFPPYRVLLHNDDVHGMDDVVHALMLAVPGLGHEQALRIMLEAHLTGHGLVIVCPLEQAEYYSGRLASYGLTVSIEIEC